MPPVNDRNGVSQDTRAGPGLGPSGIRTAPDTKPPLSAPLTTNRSQQDPPKEEKPAVLRATNCLFSGVGQIMFGGSPITGALVVVGLGLGSPLMAVGTGVGSCIGSLWALARGYPRDEIKQGLYGFNSALVGLAMMVQFNPSLGAGLLMGAGCIMAAEITRAMKQGDAGLFKIPDVMKNPYTAPFVVSTWVAWGIGWASDLNPVERGASILSRLTSFFPKSFPFELPTLLNPMLQILSETFTGIGQVLLQQSAVVGMIFAGGLFLSSRKAAVAGIAGAALAAYVAPMTGLFSSEAIAQGLLGYNAALCAIAFTLGEALDRKKVFAAAAASLVTLPLCAGFASIGAPALTAPFVLSTWLVSSLMPRKEPVPSA